MKPPLIFGPIPPYQNVQIEPQFYKPRQFFISGIALGPTTTITTTADMDYVIGQLIRLLIPNLYGSRGLNGQTGYVIDIPASNQVTVDINSNGMDQFIDAMQPTQAQIVPVGDVNNGLISNTGRALPIRTIPNIPGSFQNISPQ